MAVVSDRRPSEPAPVEAQGVGPRIIHMTVARTSEEAEALRPHFEQMPARDIDSDLDFFLTVNRHGRSRTRPHVMILHLGDGREMRVVARLDERPSRLRVRPLRVLQVTIGGVVGAETETDCRLVVESLRRVLADGEADMLVLSHLEVDGGLYKAAQADAEWWQPDPKAGHFAHWRADLPSSIDAFLQSRSSKTRSNVRYYRKKLLQTHGDTLEVRAFSDADCLEWLHRDIEAVAAHTYQRGLGVGYNGDALQRALIDLTARRGSLRAWVLYIAKAPAAFWFGWCFRDTFVSIANAFDPALSDLRVGQYLQMEVMGTLCEEPDVRVFDWGIGSAEYKRRFGDRVTYEAEIVLLRRSVRGRRIAAAIMLRALVAGVMQRVVGKTQLATEAKRRWRKRAETRAARAATSATARQGQTGSAGELTSE